MFSPSFAPAFNDSHSMMSGLPSAGSALYPFAGDADSMYGMQTMVNTSPNSNSNSNSNVGVSGSASWNTDPFANPPPIQNVQSVPTVQFESEFAMAPQSKDEEIQALRRQNGLLMQRVVDQQIQIETMSSTSRDCSTLRRTLRRRISHRLKLKLRDLRCIDCSR